MSETQLNTFLHTNAPALLLSYVRTYIEFNTTQAEFLTFNIPFMNFYEHDFLKREEETV